MSGAAEAAGDAAEGAGAVRSGAVRWSFADDVSAVGVGPLQAASATARTLDTSHRTITPDSPRTWRYRVRRNGARTDSAAGGRPDDDCSSNARFPRRLPERYP